MVPVASWRLLKDQCVGPLGGQGYVSRGCIDSVKSQIGRRYGGEFGSSCSVGGKRQFEGHSGGTDKCMLSHQRGIPRRYQEDVGHQSSFEAGLRDAIDVQGRPAFVRP
jgi:hypothetical protein